MTVRTAELLMAIICALCSIGLMVKSAELNTGWIEGRGPGAGIALMFVAVGVIATIIGLSGYLFPAIRNAEELLPDHDTMEQVEPTTA